MAGAERARLPGNQRGRATRERILLAGDRCFERSGLSVTVDEVAAEAGITRMTVHRHTGGREQMVRHLVLRASVRLAETLTVVLEGDGPLEDRLVEAMVQTVTTIRATPALAQLFAGGDVTEPWPVIDPDDDVLATVRDFYRPYLDQMAARGRLREGIDAGEAVAWLLAQALLVLVVPEVARSEAAVRRLFGQLAMPALLRRP